MTSATATAKIFDLTARLQASSTGLDAGEEFLCTCCRLSDLRRILVDSLDHAPLLVPADVVWQALGLIDAALESLED